MIKKFSIQIAFRILLIMLFCLSTSWLYTQQQWFSLFAVFLIIIGQVFALIKYVNNTNYALVRFLDALKHKDFSVYFSPTSKGSSFNALFEDFNAVIKLFKQNKIDKEAQLQYFHQMLEQINLGVVSIRLSDLENSNTDDEILFLNKAACDLLDIPKHKYWHRIVQHLPWFEQNLKALQNGGKTLVNVERDTKFQQLAIDVVKLKLLDDHYLIATIQDIHTEIEQKEMEAWHKVISVLAHEMMNSFTPISSLATTLKHLMEDEHGEVLPELDDEDIKDIHLGISTIQKRSAGLMDFVHDYRKISTVPVPHLKTVLLTEFLSDIDRLMRTIVEEKNVKLTIMSPPPRAMLHIDTKLMEQVFINLINNSLHALEGVENGVITIDHLIRPNQILVSIHDNGNGIPEAVIKDIFIPFYTTRQNGSGIGLSLSKSIMRQHKGQIYVQSEEGHSTTITLAFNNNLING